MEKAAESQKVHATWSQHACFGSCEESSAALVFSCVPRKKCQSQVLQTLKCERNYSAFVFGVKIHTQTEAKKCAPQRQVGYFGDTQRKHNSTNRTHTAGQVCVYPKARPDCGCVPGFGKWQRPQAGFRLICILWNGGMKQSPTPRSSSAASYGSIQLCASLLVPPLQPQLKLHCHGRKGSVGRGREGEGRGGKGRGGGGKRADCHGNICLFGGAAYCKCRWGFNCACAPAGLRL